LFISNYNVTTNDTLSVNIDVCTNWFFKNGNKKKSDIQNLIKVLIDAVSERLGFDDSQVWSMTANKIQSDSDCVFITVNKNAQAMILGTSGGVSVLSPFLPSSPAL